MIFVIAGTYAAYRELCYKLKIHPVKDAKFIHPGSSQGLRGYSMGGENRLILTCGYYNDPEWYFYNVIPTFIDKNYEPEKISCCHKQDVDAFF